MIARVFFVLFAINGPSGQNPGAQALADLRSLPAPVVSIGPSLAVGAHGGGSLYGGLRYDRSHPELRVLRRSRRNGYDYGHARLVRALEDISERYSRTVWPPAPLWLGNTGNRAGGKIAPSRSHQTGLDVDIIFPTLGTRRPEIERVELMGEGDDPLKSGSSRPLLDVAASWTLVQAILETTEVEVLWLFVSRPIRDALIEHAVRVGAPEELVGRALHLLHQPSDSRPHDDHLHLRIACSASDRLWGCRDVGARWPWLNTGERAVRTVLTERLVGAWIGTDERRIEALTRLRSVTVRGLGDLILPFLFWPEVSVRVEAAKTLRRGAPRLLVEWSHGHFDPTSITTELSRASLGAPGPSASALMVDRLSRTGGCGRNKGSDEVDVALRVLRRYPTNDALPFLKECVANGRRRTSQMAKESLARLAGRPVPRGSRARAIRVLSKAITTGPSDRLIRMEQHYLPSKGARRTRALRRLKGRVLAAGVDGMNARELLERLYGFGTRTNDTSAGRRRRIWRNRASLMKYVPVPLEDRTLGVE